MKYINFFKIKGSSCYDVKIGSPKYVTFKYLKLEFPHVFSFSCVWRKNEKVFGKNTMAF